MSQITEARMEATAKRLEALAAELAADLVVPRRSWLRLIPTEDRIRYQGGLAEAIASLEEAREIILQALGRLEEERRRVA